MKQSKLIFGIVVALILFGGGVYGLWQTGFFEAASSLDGIQRYIGHFTPYSHLIFFLLQLASTIIAPIPNNITAAAGALLYGMWPAFLLTWAAVVLGSIAVFLLSRTIGQPFVTRFVSDRISDRYLDVIKRKRDVFLLLAFVFPFFPDDLLCILAGLTDISFGRFLLLVILGRPWGLFVACAIGGSVLSIPVWGLALVGILGFILFVLGLKYGDLLEEKLLQRFKK